VRSDNRGTGTERIAVIAIDLDTQEYTMVAVGLPLMDAKADNVFLVKLRDWIGL